MVLVAEGKERLDRFLARSLPEHSRVKISRMIEDEGVLVEGDRVHKPSFELRPGWSVECGDVPQTPPHDLTPVEMGLDVRYEDEVMLVVNKPRGLTVHPAAGHVGPTLVHGLLARGTGLSQEAGSFRPGIVHRLDKETTGLMLIAKNDSAHRILAEQIKDKSAERRYVALVHGRPDHPLFNIDAPVGRHLGIPSLMSVRPGGKRAVTHVKVLGRLEAETLVACRLETGRTHQIRVHMASFGYPVIGDRLYAPDPYNKGPMQLHAAYLKFSHPLTGGTVEVYAEPPDDFVAAAMVTREAVVSWS